MIDTIHRLIEIISIFISVIGVMVVLWGTLAATIGFLRLKLTKSGLLLETDLRLELGGHLLLGLEIFIAADIISSVASPSWNKVGILSAIVGIRTVLSFFLTREICIEREGQGFGFRQAVRKTGNAD